LPEQLAMAVFGFTASMQYTVRFEPDSGYEHRPAPQTE
jgi:hypothetical protein